MSTGSVKSVSRPDRTEAGPETQAVSGSTCATPRVAYPAGGCPTMRAFTATVLAFCLPSIQAVESSLYEALEETGNRPVRALQRLRAVLFTAEQAKLLKAQEKDAGLLVERLGFLKDGRAVEFTQSFYRGDIYDFVAELSAIS